MSLPVVVADGDSAAAAIAPADVPKIKHSNYVPTQLDRHMQSLSFNQEGHLLLGCSSLTTRYWTGSLWYYNSPTDAPSVDNCLTGVDLDNGLFEAIFVGDTGKQMLAALDNGAIDHFNLAFSKEDTGPSFHFLDRTTTIYEHNDLITGLVRTCDEKSLITGSYDRSMVVHDLPTLAKKKELINAHKDLILSVDASRCNPDVFVSSSQDGTVAVWDMRQEDGGMVVYDNVGLPPTCVQYVPGEENFLVVGSAAGAIGLYDVRRPKEYLYVDSDRKDQIYKFRFSQKRPNLLAVGSDSSLVRVFSVDVHSPSALTSRYSDENRHTDFVRGLAWHPTSDILWTCSWDSTVLSHQIP